MLRCTQDDLTSTGIALGGSAVCLPGFRAVAATPRTLSAGSVTRAFIPQT